MDVGNTPSNAKTIRLFPKDRTFADGIGGGDRADYYRFTLKASSKVKVNLAGLGDLSLLNSEGAVIKPSGKRLKQTLDQGTYFLRVASNAVSSSNYKLTVNAAWLQPNVLLVVADDFGTDASPLYANGSQKPKMPTLQSLARNGIVYDNAWVNPVCTPTRASIYTGKYGFRTQVGEVDDLLSTQETSIYQAVSRTATPYSNAVVGKWHVGGENPDANSPAQLGVQYYSGFLSGGVEDYSNWNGVEQGRAFNSRTYTTSFFTDKAIRWVDRQRQPWLLSLTYNAPHTPFHKPPAQLSKRSRQLSGTEQDIRQNPQAYYFAAAEAMDAELGRFLKNLPAQTRNNTVVMFVGDNGTPRRVVQAPYRVDGAKGTVKEGGVKVPLIISGAGITRKNQREDALVNGTDLFATIADITGASATTGVDSLSLKDSFSNANFAGRDYAYTEFFGDRVGGRRNEEASDRPGNIWAIRDQQYKLIHNVTTGEEELYNLAIDPGESTNLLLGSNIDPAIALRLRNKAQELRQSGSASGILYRP
jgi:arylsulfatase A-like enzyme